MYRRYRLWYILCLVVLLGGCGRVTEEDAAVMSLEDAAESTSEEVQESSTASSAEEPSELSADQLKGLYAEWGSQVTIRDVLVGDIGNDGEQDAVVLAEYPTHDGEGVYQMRTVFVLLYMDHYEPENLYRHDGLIRAEWMGGAMGDPYVGMEISDGLLKIYEYGGSAERWSWTKVFNLEEGTLIWERCEYAWFNIHDAESGEEQIWELHRLAIPFGEDVSHLLI